MSLRDAPIRQKLMRVLLLTCAVVLFVTCASYFTYEFITFRQSTVRELSVLGRVIAANSTAALAFDDAEAAQETLGALKAEEHIVAAALYDRKGNLFSAFPPGTHFSEGLANDITDEYRFEESHIVGYEPVMLEDQRLGTLYLKSDLGAIYERIFLFGTIAVLVILVSLLAAYMLSRNLQRVISQPILALADTAKVVSSRKDYATRAVKYGNDELGYLTDAFNGMLEQIGVQDMEIRQFSQKLEQKIIERTQAYEAANKELEAFSYSVSHDLRAPLRSIHGYARVLVEDYADKFDEEGRRTLDIIIRNSLRMGALIDDLLAFSRMGRQTLTKVHVNMQSLINEVVEELRSGQSNEVEYNYKRLLMAYGDNSMLKQAVTNLISNALKYSAKKPKSIIEIGSYEDNGFNVFYIKDNGAGFDMQYYGKLFGVFQRLHGNNEFEGTGVGLALVKRIISRHGGNVWAEAVLNEGATFYISLPNNPDSVTEGADASTDPAHSSNS